MVLHTPYKLHMRKYSKHLKKRTEKGHKHVSNILISLLHDNVGISIWLSTQSRLGYLRFQCTYSLKIHFPLKRNTYLDDRLYIKMRTHPKYQNTKLFRLHSRKCQRLGFIWNKVKCSRPKTVLLNFFEDWGTTSCSIKDVMTNFNILVIKHDRLVFMKTKASTQWVPVNRVPG